MDGLFFPNVPIVEGNLLTKEKEKEIPYSVTVYRCRVTVFEQVLVCLPVGNEAGVDIAVLSLVALLCDRHLTYGPPKSGQEQS